MCVLAKNCVTTLEGIGLDGPLSLDCAWDFAEHVRSCHGFRKAEQARTKEKDLTGLDIDTNQRTN